MNNTPTVIKATNSSDLLTVIPHLLGALPSRSIVLVPFTGGRSAGAFRIDLPDPTVDATEIAQALTAMAARVDYTTAVALIIYTDEHIAEALDVWRPLADAFAAECKHAEMELFDALCVAGDGWAGFAAGDVIHDQAPALAVIPGQEAPKPLDGRSVLPEVPLSISEAVAAVIVDRDLDAINSNRSDLTDAIESSLGHTASLPTEVLADLALILSEPSSRDVALIQWMGSAEDGDQAQRYQRAFLDGRDPAPIPLLNRFIGAGPRPDAARLGAALEVSRQVAAAAPKGIRSGAIVACAWLSWAFGQSSTAAAYLAQVEQGTPASSMAEILASIIDHGHLPDWCFDRR